MVVIGGFWQFLKVIGIIRKIILNRSIDKYFIGFMRYIFLIDIGGNLLTYRLSWD